MGIEDLSHDAFLGGRVHLWQPRQGYRAGLDPVLLAASVDARSRNTVLDLGCGAGAAALCLGARVGGLDLHGLEIQDSMADLAQRNADEAGQTMTVHRGCVSEMPGALRQMSFDHVMANPPYYLRETGSKAPDMSRETSLGEVTPLRTWVREGARRLKPKGFLHLVLKADRLADALTAMEVSLGSLRVLPIAPRAGRNAELVILQARKGGKARMQVHAPVLLHEGDHHPGDRAHYTSRISDVLRRGTPLEF